eukprot:CAMPEP_0204379990 /NCGR_PEP_ID=MMETSP0469-20131031/53021_1 /ASSEMBLY_ACC=CAM_ASM_000384 /TAXON_ID=2969 /ORGANISM="Oxyrrhis marina" /LENGTH=34 /DNA_ID= /DNA_START= /DNA_END= /DNA_ORIENTATION=
MADAVPARHQGYKQRNLVAHWADAVHVASWATSR